MVIWFKCVPSTHKCFISYFLQNPWWIFSYWYLWPSSMSQFLFFHIISLEYLSTLSLSSWQMKLSKILQQFLLLERTVHFTPSSYYSDINLIMRPKAVRGGEDRSWKLSAYYFEATTQMESLKHFVARKIGSLSWRNRAASIGNNIAGGLLDSKFQLSLLLPNVMAPFLPNKFYFLGSKWFGKLCISWHSNIVTLQSCSQTLGALCYYK